MTPNTPMVITHLRSLIELDISKTTYLRLLKTCIPSPELSLRIAVTIVPLAELAVVWLVVLIVQASVEVWVSPVAAIMLSRVLMPVFVVIVVLVNKLNIKVFINAPKPLIK